MMQVILIQLITASATHKIEATQVNVHNLHLSLSLSPSHHDLHRIFLMTHTFFIKGRKLLLLIWQDAQGIWFQEFTSRQCA